jgi:ACR3 family arsenite efflux pump ArsB
MRLTTASIAVAAAAVAWRIPVFNEVWMRYAVFVCAPFLAGIGIRRVLMRRKATTARDNSDRS